MGLGEDVVRLTVWRVILADNIIHTRWAPSRHGRPTGSWVVGSMHPGRDRRKCFTSTSTTCQSLGRKPRGLGVCITVAVNHIHRTLANNRPFDILPPYSGRVEGWRERLNPLPTEIILPPPRNIPKTALENTHPGWPI